MSSISIAKVGRLAGKVAIVTGWTVISYTAIAELNISLQVAAQAMAQA